MLPFNFRVAGALLAPLFLLAGSACAHAAPVAAPAGAAPVAAATQTLAPVALRGYGTLSASFRALPNNASVLQINAQSVAKAQLVHAKFLSDLSVLPGVTAAQNGVRTVAGQGAVAALRDGAKVLILSAPTAQALASLIQTQSGGRALPRAAEVAVPMYLDRWDKHGFRFYYRENQAPQGVDWRNYDNAQDFQYARDQKVGLVFWNHAHQVDTALGQMNESWMEWGPRMANQYGLPIAINTNVANGQTPGWLLNRYWDQEQRKMPQFLGNYYRLGSQEFSGQGVLSWNSDRAADEELGMTQASLRRFAKLPNVVSFLEPHGELDHGPHDVFLEYGPVADATYRTYLKEKYGTVAAVGTRWYGDAARFKSWNDVRVPEVADFGGWGPNALDLTGTWRIGYEPFADGRERSAVEIQNLDNGKVETQPAPDEWYQPTFDDSAWPQGTAPGDQHAYFWAKRPAVFRRTFAVSSEWKAQNPRVYLYLWDLNKGYNDTVRVVLNGREVGKDTLTHWNIPHWNAYDVTDALRAGDNQLAMRLPKGYLAYRTYLSSQAPTQYPNFGEQGNARWTDFTDWRVWSRVGAVRRGMEMLRQVDADRQITLMAPSNHADKMKTIAENYGGEFHDTGAAGAFYVDFLPLLAQGSNLPVSVEPGAPAPDLATFKKMMGLYLSEGTQGIDYFIHIGNVLWKPDIKAEFERTSNQIHTIGKFHAPKAEVAVLFSEQVQKLTDYPWGNDPNVNLKSGYWNFNISANLRDRYTRDGLTEGDFKRGNASKYRVIIDTNTSIMDESLVSDIEKYVRDGGTFVTYVQTGRHTPTRKDAWPIERLTGFKVTRVNRYNADGQVPPEELKELKVAPGSEVYRAGDFAGARANGLTLQAVAPDAKPLLLWEDGGVAVGARPMGKGWVVEVGAKFFGDYTFDRIEAYGNTGDVQRTARLMQRLLEWRGIAPTPARLSTGGAPDGPVILRHWESNNGLYNVWTLWNQTPQTAVTTDLLLDAGVAATSAVDVLSGASVALEKDGQGAKLPAITLQPLESRVFLTPRNQLPNAGLNWLQLQRTWWRGTQQPAAKTLPVPRQDSSRDISDGWTYANVTAQTDVAALSQAPVKTPATQTVRFGTWNASEPGRSKHGVLTRTFTVPAEWKSGRTRLWVQSWFDSTFAGQGRVFLDGRLIKDWSGEGVAGDDLSSALKAGTTHTLAVEARNDAAMVGSRGSAWLSFVPTPLRSIDLSGQWSPSQDMLRYGAPITLPGEWNTQSARRTIQIPASEANQTVILNMETDGHIVGAFINGHWVRRHHHMIGRSWQLNVSPWIKAGENTIELGTWEGPKTGRVHAVSLDVYKPGSFF